MGTLHTYLAGFGFSLMLTSTSFFVVWMAMTGTQALISREVAVLIAVGLAVVQLFVQLRFFLHMGQERHGRWNLIMFVFALVVVTILVVGTLWIMNNMQHGSMPSMSEM